MYKLLYMRLEVFAKQRGKYLNTTYLPIICFLSLQSYEGYLDTWNVCSLFLGLGNLLVWFGCLRYLGFFTTYNASVHQYQVSVLISVISVTLKVSSSIVDDNNFKKCHLICFPLLHHIIIIRTLFPFYAVLGV